MAYLETVYCSTCKIVTQHCNGKCSPCGHKRMQDKLDAWNAQTTEEKLNDLRERVEYLERGDG